MDRTGSPALAVLAALALSAGLCGPASAAPAPAPAADASTPAGGTVPSGTTAGELTAQAGRWLAQNPLAVAPNQRVETTVGEPDARLHLAPCRQVQVSLPPGLRLWGRTRLAAHCQDGPTHWTVYLPVTVKVWAPGTVARNALAAGSVLSASDLVAGEIDLAEETGTPCPADASALVGRVVQRPVAVGQGLRSTHLKPRIWFAAGDVVKVLAAGDGFAVSGEGVAMTAGVEGQPARVRTEGGRVLVGNATGQRLVEMPL